MAKTEKSNTQCWLRYEKAETSTNQWKESQLVATGQRAGIGKWPVWTTRLEGEAATVTAP